MKVAILSESSADEAATRIIINGIVGEETQDIRSLPLRSRGWPYVLQILPTVIKFLHYQTDADALAVIADSDDSSVHQNSHDQADGKDLSCRFCQLRNVVNSERNRLRPIPGRMELKIAIGLAVPSIEAWYLCGMNPHVNEATWARGLQSERITYTRNTLKEEVYGTERPTIEIETHHAIEAATRLVKDVALIEQLFPNGFASFANSIRSW